MDRKPFWVLLVEKGFVRIPKGDPREFDEYPTYERGAVRVAMAQESLYFDGRAVTRYGSTGSEIALHGLLVEPSARRQGLATKALEDFCEIADQLQCDVYLEPVPFEHNVGSDVLAAFYMKKGFVWTPPSESRVLIREALPVEPFLKERQRG